jgi:hypothetical protein
MKGTDFNIPKIIRTNTIVFSDAESDDSADKRATIEKLQA